MRRYDSYKDSGIEWIGEIPGKWQVVKNKLFLCERKERSTEGDEELLSVSEYYGVAKRADKIEAGDILVRAESLIDYKIVKKNDLVINIMLAWKKGLGISEYEGIVSPAYCVYYLTQPYSPKFFHYLYRTDLFANIFKAHSTGIIDSRLRLYTEELFQIISIVPPVLEQIAIASFLDRKTTEIDQLIADKKRLIELYKEEKTAIINQAVTKGIDPNVKLKDSGIEWLGEIPEHWKVKRFDFLFSFFRGLTITKENLTKEGIPCVNYGEIHSKYGFEVNPDKDILMCVNKDYLISSKKSLLKRGDFVFADTSEDIKGSGNFTYLNSDVPTFAGYHTIIANPIDKFVHRFVAYFFESLSFRNQIRCKVTGTKVYSITQSILKSSFVILPPFLEQEIITQYIETECSRIDAKISKTKKLIDLLTEYRTTLISEVVTGKIKVI